MTENKEVSSGLDKLIDDRKNKIENALNNISTIQKFIEKAIDDSIGECKNQVTVTEIQSALINVIKRFNQKELLTLVK